LDGLVERADALAAAGATPMYVSIGNQAAGLVAVADTLKPESREAVQQLRALGLDVWMLTGDNRATAEAIARELGIPSERVIAEVLPHQKTEKVRQLQAEGRVVANGWRRHQRRAGAGASGPGYRHWHGYGCRDGRIRHYADRWRSPVNCERDR